MKIGSKINHDYEIGDFMTISSEVTIAGNVTIEDRCKIENSTKIINNMFIVKGSFMGAGAVVVKDIPKNVLAIGMLVKRIRNLKESDWEELILIL